MISRVLGLLRKIRRHVSRHEVSVRLLSLPRDGYVGGHPGLILVQIDGLSRPQIEAALQSGKMPFLSHLIERERYQLNSFYSGLPSTTPAVQAELFFGIKTAVPAFQFRDKEQERITSLFEPHTAREMEQQLQERGENLLEGGSCYSDMYAAGEEKSSFCMSTLGLSGILKQARLRSMLKVLILHATTLVRVLVLMLIELLLALHDMIRGIYHRENIFKEIKFVPTRVALCVLLRDLVALGVRMDAARGLPVIHCNFFGYDEQAHRRGPSSRFAHWTLKGIDRAIKTIWLAAHRSAQRTYDVWVYSDHGQETVQSYQALHGRSVQEAVAEVLAAHGIKHEATEVGPDQMVLRRAGMLGSRLLQKLLRRPSEARYVVPAAVAAMGPVGHVYVEADMTDEQRNAVAADLIQKAHIPCAMAADAEETITVWTSDGTFTLPDDAVHVLGRRHPFLHEVAEDLVDLVRHPEAGEFVISGWRPDGPTLSFPIEHGAHAGPGYEETHGFALVPKDVPIPLRHGRYIRPLDLRHAALWFLRRASSPVAAFGIEPRKRLRVMTYNVHSCIGMDRRIAPERIARVIASYNPDVVALQELDVGRDRTHGWDQARIIADFLEMEFHFHASFIVGQEKYGNAILSRLPLRVVRAGALPGPAHFEPRGAVWAELLWNNEPLNLITTHLGLRARERARQLDLLLGPQWLGHEDCQRATILCGDMNAAPFSRVYSRLARRLLDCQASHDEASPAATFLRLVRLDYIFATADIRVLGSFVPRTYLTWLASDHLPLITDILTP